MICAGVSFSLTARDGQGGSVAAAHTGDYAITSIAVIDHGVPASDHVTGSFDTSVCAALNL